MTEVLSEPCVVTVKRLGVKGCFGERGPNGLIVDECLLSAAALFHKSPTDGMIGHSRRPEPKSLTSSAVLLSVFGVPSGSGCRSTPRNEKADCRIRPEGVGHG